MSLDPDRIRDNFSPYTLVMLTAISSSCHVNIS